MNWYLLIAGVLAAFAVVGHFTVGGKKFLKPMLAADFDPIARKTLHFAFHFSSVFLMTSAAVLLIFGSGVQITASSRSLVYFIAANYTGFVVWQIALALTSGIERPLMKMFQWVFFVPIAIFAWLGA